MFRTRLSPAVCLLASFVAAAHSLAEQLPGTTPPSDPIVSRVYRVQHIDLMEAYALARAQCPSISSPCGGDIERDKGFFELRADPATHERVTAMLLREDLAPLEHSLRVILLKADDRPETTAAALPPQALEALKDVQSFLPFKSFQVIGAGQVVTSGGSVELTIEGQYRILMRIEPRRPSEPSVNIRSFEVLSDSKKAPLLSTSLRMSPNETVVVGTSTSEGGKQALVALLSAAPLH